MKKAGLFLAILLYVNLTFGQVVNFQSGITVSQLDWKISGTINSQNSLFNKSYTSYSTFLGLDYLNKEHFYLSTNVGLIKKGGKDERQSFTNETETVKASLDYLALNTLLNLKYDINERYTPFVCFGPQIGYLISYNDQFDNINNYLEKKSFGIVLGGGLKYKISKFQLGLRTDYYSDFSKVGDWTGKRMGGGGKIAPINAYSFSFSIGYKLK